MRIALTIWGFVRIGHFSAEGMTSHFCRIYAYAHTRRFSITRLAIYVKTYMELFLVVLKWHVHMTRKPKTFDKELFFRALADRTRLRLLNLMGREEVCVCFFVEILKTNQPKISRHLAYLRRAGVVGARREGQWMHYRIIEPDDSDAARVLKDILSWLANDQEMQRDRQRLVKICCAPQLPISIQGAPRPIGLAQA